MNTKLISGYLQFLRKSHNYTQDDLAKKFCVSRQAVSKWETETAIPDLEILLELSKFYGVTINDILEAKVLPQRITGFEQILAIPEKEWKEAVQLFDADALAIALMGASPEMNALVEREFPEIDFGEVRKRIGQVQVGTVEDVQSQIVSMINLRAAGVL